MNYNKYLVQLFKEAGQTPPHLPKPDQPIDGSPEAPESRPMHDSDPDSVATNFLDQGTDPTALDTDAMPSQVQDAFNQLKTDMAEFSDKIDGMKNEIMSKDTNSILPRLAKYQNAPGIPPQYQQMAIELKKVFQTAYEALGKISATLIANGIVADNVKSVEAEKELPTG